MEFLGRMILLDRGLTHLKVLSSLKSTFLHCSAVQSLYLRANASLFFIIDGVRSGLAAGLYVGRPSSFCNRCCIVCSDTPCSKVGWLLLSSPAVISGLLSVSRGRMLSVCLEVFLGLPGTDFRGGTTLSGRQRAVLATRHQMVLSPHPVRLEISLVDTFSVFKAKIRAFSS